MSKTEDFSYETLDYIATHRDPALHWSMKQDVALMKTVRKNKFN